MTLKDVFNKAAELGGFPEVEMPNAVKHAESNKGKIDAIRTYGIGVRFEGMKWSTFFYNTEETDRRKHYMYQLKFT